MGATIYEGLDVRAVARHPAAGPSTCDLVIYHGGRELEDLLSVGESDVVVLAGYRDDQGPVEIARGRPIPDTVETDHSSQDRPTECQISSSRGSSARAVLSAAWVDVAASEVLQFVADQAGVELDARLATDPIFPSYTIGGGMLSVLRDLAAATGSELQISPTAIRMWPSGEVARVTAEVWSPSTGLRTASATGRQITASCLLSPAMRPGDSIRLLSTRYNGDVRVTEVVHEIDSYGGTWYTSIKGVPR